MMEWDSPHRRLAGLACWEWRSGLPGWGVVFRSYPSLATGLQSGPRCRSSPSPKGWKLPLRILIADDHTVVRDGLRAVLEQQPGMEVVGEACDGRECVRLAEEQ